jgi:hypothetical protein
VTEEEQRDNIYRRYPNMVDYKENIQRITQHMREIIDNPLKEMETRLMTRPLTTILRNFFETSAEKKLFIYSSRRIHGSQSNRGES